MNWDTFGEFYNGFENFDYPHKDKLLEFIKYFFLDHIESENVLKLNYQAFKEHLSSKRMTFSTDRTRNDSALRTWREKRSESESSKIKAKPESDNEESKDEEKMLDIAEHCFMRIADLLH